MGRCVRLNAKLLPKKVLTLSIRMQKSRAEIIELTGRAACSSATIYRQISYVVFVVCKSCLTSLYEFVCSMDGWSAEYDRGLSYLLCRWLNMQMHFHTFAQSADKGKQRERERERKRELFLGALSISIFSDLEDPVNCFLSALMQTACLLWDGRLFLTYSRLLTKVQVITQSASYII